MNKGLFFAAWSSFLVTNFKGAVDITVQDVDEGKVLIGVTPVKYVEGKEVDVEVIECSNVASSNDESTLFVDTSLKFRRYFPMYSFILNV